MDWILFLLPISNFHLLHLFLRLLNTHHCNAICPHLQTPAITETAPGSDETVVVSTISALQIISRAPDFRLVWGA